VKICVFGAGAIGGYLGGMLARAGCEVSLVARGPHLAAIQKNGLTLWRDGKSQTYAITATDSAAELGPQDFVLVTLKAHALSGVVADVRKLLGPDTAVVSAVNGLPWWYFHGLDSPNTERPLESVDPGGLIWRGIGPERAIGCVVYPSVEVPEPGVIRHLSDDKFSLGEPSGERSERVRTLARVFIDAGLKAPVRPRIRDEIWVKLWGNLSFNPLSALTMATLDVLADDAGIRVIARAMMVEAQAVGEKHGIRFAVDVDRRIDAAASVGAHRTSMLQDLEQGRPLEIAALVESVMEVARLVGQPTPTIDLVHALLRQRIRARDS
jgi:2-dehydropantoate 2-reductase